MTLPSKENKEDVNVRREEGREMRKAARLMLTGNGHEKKEGRRERMVSNLRLKFGYLLVMFTIPLVNVISFLYHTK